MKIFLGCVYKPSGKETNYVFQNIYNALRSFTLSLLLMKLCTNLFQFKNDNNNFMVLYIYVLNFF